MSQGKRLPLAEAQDLSKLLTWLLEPACEKIIVAGSVRRCKPMVGDVEIVALATDSVISDLFGAEVSTGRTSIDFALDELNEKKDTDWRTDPTKQGKFNKRLRHTSSGLVADLYVLLDRRAWGSHVAIRTGPRIFSKEIVTKAHGEGKHFANGFLLHDHIKRRTPCTPDCDKIIPLLQEADVFEVLKIHYLSPEQREEKYGSGI